MNGQTDWVQALGFLDDYDREMRNGTAYVRFNRSALLWEVVDLEDGSSRVVGSKRQAMLAAGFSEVYATLMTDLYGFDMRRDGIRRELLVGSPEEGTDFVELIEKMEGK